MKGKRFDEKPVHTAIYLRELERQHIKSLRERYGLCNDSDAIRMAINWCAEHLPNKTQLPTST